MKLHSLALAIGLLASAASAQAAVIAMDDFDYPSGELNGRSGGSGWAGSWTAVTGVTEIVDPAVDLVDDRALLVTGNDNNAASRGLASTFSGSQLFVDFHVQIAGGSLTANDFLSLWLDTGAAGDHAGHRSQGRSGRRRQQRCLRPHQRHGRQLRPRQQRRRRRGRHLSRRRPALENGR